jgi:hypothetical protein
MKRNIFFIFIFFLSVGGYYVYKAFFIEKENIVTQPKYESKATLRYPDEKSLKVGDIVFRRMYDADSIIALNFSEGEKRYSHVGLVVDINGSLKIIHSLKDNYNSGVRLDTIRGYLSETKVWAVYRYEQISNKNINKHILAYLNKNITFDNDFDLHTDNKMYCTEFVYKVINTSLEKKVKKAIQASKFFANKMYVTVSDLYENTNCHLVESSHKRLNNGEKNEI